LLPITSGLPACATEIAEASTTSGVPREVAAIAVIIAVHIPINMNTEEEKDCPRIGTNEHE